jgi:thioredoxin-dependent peroxiredoxin
MDIPPFTLTAMDGSPFTQKDLKGQTTVLFFYPKDDTPGCVKEACGIRDNWGAFKKKGIAVYGVSKDDAASHEKFQAKYELPFPLLTADHENLEKFGVWKSKSLYGRTFLGISRETFVFDKRGKLVKHYEKVKPEGHAAELLADIDVMAGSI